MRHLTSTDVNLAPLYTASVVPLKTVVSGMFVICLFGCVASLPVSQDDRHAVQNPVIPAVAETSSEESLPVPPSCHQATCISPREANLSSDAFEVPPLPALHSPVVIDPVSIDAERLNAMDEELKRLTEKVRRHDQELSDADSNVGQMKDLLQERTTEMQRALSTVRQTNAGTNQQLNLISQKLTRLEAAQLTDQVEQDRLMDEIISGLEQVLNLGPYSPD